ncbi:diamine acetyltransferase 2-like isoform X3 [Trachemys scripta elegans]|uniref:diamine acetyltransferase 2-like isoform X3 n=1 Tax=Trachemys scripta elegans TaxID=31138 RepID=UPI001556C214|nr:diamine acetyltransferase 2-like isoform X3 [Trachemys scripta elegans]
MNCIIRPCTVKDCKVILQFIKELAIDYKVPPTDVKVTLEALREDGFGARPRYDCYLAELPPGETNKEGRQIGKQLLEKAVQAAIAKGCCQLRMHVGNWKANEMGFLAHHGGEDLTAKEGWALFRFEEDALQRLAARSTF